MHAMAANDEIELINRSSSYPRQWTQGQSTRSSKSLWQLLECAVKNKLHSPGAKVLHDHYTETRLSNFIDSLEITVHPNIPEPEAIKETIVDFNVKDYANYSNRDQDETVVKMTKSTSSSVGRMYNLSVTEGVDFGVGSIVGVNKILQAGFGASYNRKKETSTSRKNSKESTIRFEYHQEETIRIPPKMKMRVQVTTYSVRYEQGYTITFTVSSNYSIPVHYKSPACCGLIPAGIFGFSSCSVTARDILQTLPDFQEKDGKISFTQCGALQWVGDKCSVKKTLMRAT